MKKTISLVLSLVIISLSFFGCEKPEEEEFDPDNSYHCRLSFKECEDGWVFFNEYNYVLSDSGEHTDKYFNVDAVKFVHIPIQ